MRMVSSTSSSTHCEQEIRIGSIIVVTKGIMIGQEGTIVSIDNGWLKVETPVGKVTLRAEETKVISNGGERSSPLEAENRYKAHVTGLTAQVPYS